MMKFNYRTAIMTMSAGMACLANANAEPASDKTESPNIILILADDLGWSSLSTYMNRQLPDSKSDYYETPNIARFASEGMVFSQGYAPAALSCPSRRGIQYGQMSMRMGEETFADKYDPLKHDYLTIPLMLKKANKAYRTAHYGKWDLRGFYSPEMIGYDESDGNTGNGNGNNMNSSKEDKWHQYFISKDPKRIETLTERAIDFIERNTRSHNPFYLQLSHYATHVEIHTTEESYGKFDDKIKGKKHNNPAWAGMLYDLDKSIGKLLTVIDSLGIADNTYIFFMTDNGGSESIPPVKNKMDHPSAYDHIMVNYPLRGGKWVLYEGGIRVPLIVKGPDVKAESQCDVPVTGWDLLPTFAELASYKKALPSTIDGGSFRSLLKTGEGNVNRNEESLIFHRYSHLYPHSAIRLGDYKLVKIWKTGKSELYNLREDVGELNDIASENPDKVQELESTMMNYMKKVDAEILTTLNNYMK